MLYKIKCIIIIQHKRFLNLIIENIRTVFITNLLVDALKLEPSIVECDGFFFQLVFSILQCHQCLQCNKYKDHKENKRVISPINPEHNILGYPQLRLFLIY